jgi:hypothetical protein
MPFYGLIDGNMERPGNPRPRRATCPECRTTLIAKTGGIITWHWAHEAAPGDCAYKGESEWHLAWKARGLPGTQEVWRHDFTRRADIYSPAGFAVEFQRSRMTKAEDKAALPDKLPEDAGGVRTPAQVPLASPQVSDGCAGVRGVHGGWEDSTSESPEENP